MNTYDDDHRTEKQDMNCFGEVVQVILHVTCINENHVFVLVSFVNYSVEFSV
jgi:hypothetical protein